MKKKICLAAVLLCCLSLFLLSPKEEESLPAEGYLKWVEFDIPYSALNAALAVDIDTHDTNHPVSWIDLLACLGVKYGGNWGKYRYADLQKMADTLSSTSAEELMADNKYYSYYAEAYEAVLGGMVGPYRKEAPDPGRPGEKTIVEKYGLKAYCPIAEGFGYSHYDDFGNSRDYGYRRRHLGNDLLGAVGTPIVSVESGIVEHLGWNQYGGWRVGIRSLDGKRYYYYAHMRKDHPYHKDLYEGKVVKAGEVIGYLGMTGYSTSENVNGMTRPHLHFGIQLIFDESQTEENEIWINAYEIVRLLSQNKATVERDEESKEYYRKYDIFDPVVAISD